MAETFTIEGGAALSRALQRGEAAAVTATNREIVAVTLRIETRSKREAPMRTGALRADIHHAINQGMLAGLVEGRVVSGTAIDYAAPVHQGHRTQSGSVVAGNPYLLRALRQSQEEFRSSLHKIRAAVERGAL